MLKVSEFKAVVVVDEVSYAVEYGSGKLVFNLPADAALAVCDKLGGPSVHMAPSDKRGVPKSEVYGVDTASEAKPEPKKAKAAEKPSEDTDEEPAVVAKPSKAAKTKPAESSSELTEWDEAFIDRAREERLRTPGILTALCEGKTKASELLEHCNRVKSSLPPLAKMLKLDDWKQRLEIRCEAHGLEFDI